MLDPFQALSWFAGVKVPEADSSNLREQARSLREFAKVVDDLAHKTEKAVAVARLANDSLAVDRFADVWPDELAPRYAAISADLRQLADGCDDYAKSVDEHREQLWIIGTQLAAVAFTMMFGFLYPGARAAGEAIMKWLVARAKLERTVFQKVTKMILEARIGKYRVGTYVVREGLDALADATLWTVVKTGVHVASSAATGQPIGSVWGYMGKHFVAEMTYNGGIKALRDSRKFFPATKVTDTLLGTGPAGNFFRRTVSAASLYNLTTGSISDEATFRSALAHAPRAFIFKR